MMMVILLRLQVIPERARKLEMNCARKSIQVLVVDQGNQI